MIEGVGILLTRMTAPPPAPVPMVEMPGPAPTSASARPVASSSDASAAGLGPIPEPVGAEASTSGTSSGGGGRGWVSSWFGGGKKQEEPATGSKSHDLTEDRFAPPPMPDFGAAPEPQFR